MKHQEIYLEQILGMEGEISCTDAGHNLYQYDDHLQEEEGDEEDQTAKIHTHLVLQGKLREEFGL